MLLITSHKLQVGYNAYPHWLRAIGRLEKLVSALYPSLAVLGNCARDHVSMNHSGQLEVALVVVLAVAYRRAICVHLVQQCERSIARQRLS